MTGNDWLAYSFSYHIGIITMQWDMGYYSLKHLDVLHLKRLQQVLLTIFRVFYQDNEHLQCSARGLYFI